MTTHDDPGTLVRRMLECFNTRQFDGVDDRVTPDYFSHVLGATGFEVGKKVWRSLVAQYPEMRLVVEDMLVDGDGVAVRSTIEGIASPDGDTRPMLIEIFRARGGPLVGDVGTRRRAAIHCGDLRRHCRCMTTEGNRLGLGGVGI